MNILEIGETIQTEFSKPLDMMWSAEELDVYFTSLVDGRYFNFVCELLAHPCMSPKIFNKAAVIWAYEFDELLLGAVINRYRKVYTSEFLKFVASQGEASVFDVLLQQFSDGIIKDDQVNILWSSFGFNQRRSMLVYSVKSEWRKDLPNYMWVEQYLSCVERHMLVRNESIFSSRFPDEEMLRLAFVDYVNGFSEGVDVSGLPLGWLIELAQAQGGAK